MKNRSSWILVLLLIVLPIISYFFLNQGSRFFRATYAELTPKGAFPESIAALRTDDGSVIKSEVDSTFLLYIGWSYAGETGENIELVRNLVQQLHERFIAERNGISAPLSMVLQVESDITELDGWNSKEFDPYCRVKVVSKEESRKTALALGIISKESDSRNFIVLVDRVGRVRQLYLNYQESTLSNLYKHMSILIPPAAKKDIIFKRDKEL